ncbi:MAG: TMEM175 family protein, partial [Acidimicrobiales bacterium]
MASRDDRRSSSPDGLLPSVGHTSSRLEAFSDGVLAIAITLLILQVGVPDADPGGLGSALAHQWPSYAAYALTFLVIGIMWVNHHELFDGIAVVTRTLMFLNLFLLLAIAFLPFPTALMAQYLREGENSHIATAVYGGTMALIGLGFVGLWFYLSRHPDLRVEGLDAEDARQSMVRALPGP